MRGIYDTILNDPALATRMRRAQNRTDYRNKPAKPAKPKERKTTMPRRSTKELETLSERKWGELTPGERRSVRNWMKRTHDDDTELDLETAGLLERNQHISIARAYAIVHNVTAEPAPTAPMEPEPAAEPAPTADTLQALADENNIQWLDAINEGRTGTWRPKGAYRAGVRDGDHPQVIAQYVGGAVA